MSTDSPSPAPPRPNTGGLFTETLSSYQGNGGTKKKSQAGTAVISNPKKNSTKSTKKLILKTNTTNTNTNKDTNNNHNNNIHYEDYTDNEKFPFINSNQQLRGLMGEYNRHAHHVAANQTAHTPDKYGQKKTITNILQNLTPKPLTTSAKNDLDGFKYQVVITYARTLTNSTATIKKLPRLLEMELAKQQEDNMGGSYDATLPQHLIRLAAQKPEADEYVTNNQLLVKMITTECGLYNDSTTPDETLVRVQRTFNRMLKQLEKDYDDWKGKDMTNDAFFNNNQYRVDYLPINPDVTTEQPAHKRAEKYTNKYVHRDDTMYPRCEYWPQYVSTREGVKQVYVPTKFQQQAYQCNPSAAIIDDMFGAGPANLAQHHVGFQSHSHQSHGFLCSSMLAVYDPSKITAPDQTTDTTTTTISTTTSSNNNNIKKATFSRKQETPKIAVIRSLLFNEARGGYICDDYHTTTVVIPTKSPANNNNNNNGQDTTPMMSQQYFAKQLKQILIQERRATIAGFEEKKHVNINNKVMFTIEMDGVTRVLTKDDLQNMRKADTAWSFSHLHLQKYEKADTADQDIYIKVQDGNMYNLKNRPLEEKVEVFREVVVSGYTMAHKVDMVKQKIAEEMEENELKLPKRETIMAKKKLLSKFSHAKTIYPKRADAMRSGKFEEDLRNKDKMGEIFTYMKNSGIAVEDDAAGALVEMLDHTKIKNAPNSLLEDKQQKKKSIIRTIFNNNSYNCRTWEEHTALLSQATQLHAIVNDVNSHNGRTPTEQQAEEMDQLEKPGIGRYMAFGGVVARDSNFFNKEEKEQGEGKNEDEDKTRLEKLNAAMLATTIRFEMMDREYKERFFIVTHTSEVLANAFAHVELDCLEKKLATKDEAEKNAYAQEEKSLKAMKEYIAQQLEHKMTWFNHRVKQYRNEIIRDHNEQYKYASKEAGGKIFKVQLNKQFNKSYRDVAEPDLSYPDGEQDGEITIAEEEDKEEDEKVKNNKMQIATNNSVSAMMKKLGNGMGCDSVSFLLPWSSPRKGDEHVEADGL